jgi:hypothetical protein
MRAPAVERSVAWLSPRVIERGRIRRIGSRPGVDHILGMQADDVPQPPTCKHV